MEKYITKEDYLEEKGINLEIELQDDDNHSNKVHRFIREVTNWCRDYLVVHYCANELLQAFSMLPEWRQERFRAGCMAQMEYVLNEGYISKNSGINAELGTITNLTGVELSREAYQEFFLGGFCNIERY